MATKTPRRKSITVNGRRFILVPVGELRKLERLAAQAEAGATEPPPLPPADTRGNRPAALYIQG
jgi:hypothetical protein